MPAEKQLCEIRDLADNVVGNISRAADGKPIVDLSEDWQGISLAINGDMQDGIGLVAPSGETHVVQGCTERDIATVRNTVRILSERQLRVLDVDKETRIFLNSTDRE